jgi:hypothetical protein
MRTACFGSYPSFRVFLAIRLQKSCVICDYPNNDISVYKISGTCRFNQS